MSAFTKGSWTVVGHPRGFGFRVVNCFGHLACEVDEPGDAVLVAAAPELLAELAAIATELAAEVGDSHPSVVRARALLRRVAGG